MDITDFNLLSKTANLTEREKRLRNRFVFSISIVASFLFLFFSTMLFLEGGKVLTAGLESTAALLFLGVAILVLKGPLSGSVYRVFISLTALVLIYLLLDGGFRDNGVYWSLIIPGIAFFLLGKREAFVWIVGFLLVSFLSAILFVRSGGILPVPMDRYLVLLVIGIVTSVLYYFYVLISETRYREIIQTIHSREELQREKDEASSLLEAVFTSAPEGIWIIDKNRITIRVNQTLCQILGRSESEIIGQHIYTFTDDAGQEVFRQRSRMTQEGRKGQKYEQNLIRPDGAVISCEFHSAPLPAIAGENSGSFAFVSDLTEKKKNESEIQKKSDELLRLNESLEEKVRHEIERRRENEQLLLQQSRLAAMGEMIGAIAHQWRQPLSILSIILQDVEDAREHGELDSDYLSTSVEAANQQILFMSDTIDDFRSFFKPSRERISFELSEIVQDTIAMVQPQMKSHSIKVDFQSSVEQVIVCGYPNEFKQVILNFLSNSRDAIAEKRKSAEGLQYFNGEIRLFLSQEGDSIRLSIEDTGGGIPEEYIAKIFDPYFTTKDEGKGTGIGLYMCKAIIEKNMNWSLSVKNIPGGACFEILIPLSATGDHSSS